MAALARDGAPEGSWIRADHQTGGRGRQGRPWIPSAGNLYASTLVRLVPGDPPPATLALVAAIALDAVILPLAGPTRLQIKWPNDILLDGKKLSGILLERQGDAIVIGFGVNLALAPNAGDRETVSLSEAGVALVGPDDMLTELARSFAQHVAQWRHAGIGAIAALWCRRAHPVGTALHVRQSDGSVSDGLFAGLDGQGGLQLRHGDGTIETILAGDVFLV